MSGQRSVYSDQIASLGPVSKSICIARQWHRISLCTSNLQRNRVRVVVEIDAALIRRIGFRHLLRAVPQAHDPCRRTKHQRFNVRKEIHSIIVIEFLRDVVRQFKMLPLIVTHGTRVA